MQLYWLILGVLAVWRITHFLNAEDGPWDIVVALRRKAGASFAGKLLDCFYCLSLWIALPTAAIIGHGAKEMAFLWLALSTGAIILERVTVRAPAVPPAIYWEESKEDSDVLRKEATSADDNTTGRSH